jgi:hypothetical protein
MQTNFSVELPIANASPGPTGAMLGWYREGHADPVALTRPLAAIAGTLHLGQRGEPLVLEPRRLQRCLRAREIGRGVFERGAVRCRIDLAEILPGLGEARFPDRRALTSCRTIVARKPLVISPAARPLRCRNQRARATRSS